MRRGALVTASLLAPAMLAAAAVLAATQEEPERAVERLGLRLERGAPMSISADELEATREPDGRERVVFQKSVVVTQADLRLECNWLEARYPTKRDGGPDRIIARGDVHIRQRGVEVSCTEAVFERLADRAVCTGAPGPATLRRGEDVVEGSKIVFDLKSGKLAVSGGARVQVSPRPGTPAAKP